jgi:hypothetical protein
MTIERRQAGRIKTKLWVDLAVQNDKRRVQCTDVSRHGLFLEMDKPPGLGKVILMKVQLPAGPFEAMATVARHGQFNVESMGGAGLKLYCLASTAKVRWDKYVADVAGESYQAKERPSRDAATFLVQLQQLDQLRAFFQKHVAAKQTVYITPPVRKIGAPVVLVLVHPQTHEELALHGAVCELDPDRPLRMGVRLDAATAASKRRFDAFIAAAPNPVQEESGGTYSFISPKLAALNAAREAAEAEQRMLSEVADEPTLELVDKEQLFDFQWNAEPDDDER